MSGAMLKRSSGRAVTRFQLRSVIPRRAFHSSVRNQREEKDDEDGDDNPWGDLDRAFENLEDKSLYKQVYLKHPSAAQQSSTSDQSTTGAASNIDPIAAMEEAIFAQAGAAAVKTTPKSPRMPSMGALSGVRFSDAPPSAGPPATFSALDFQNHNFAATAPGSSARWSEYMHDGDAEDDSPWSSLDAFVDHPDSSAQFAVPMHLQDQQKIMQLSTQQHAPHTHARQHQQQPLNAGEAFAANDDLLRQQIQLQSNQQHDTEEAMFAQAGAAAVAQLFNNSSSPTHVPADQEDSTQLSHIDPKTGGASMVDVSSKPTTSRSATAVGRVYLPPSASHLLLSTESSSGISNKGPVLHTAQLAGIMAAKRTADLIPLCHPLPLTHVDVKLHIEHGGEESWIQVECTATTAGQTGVEMEALTGCTTACLTVWDMVKAVAGKSMRIGDVMVVKKSGGKSGDWERRM